jgi:hypothetical protein
MIFDKKEDSCYNISMNTQIKIEGVDRVLAAHDWLAKHSKNLGHWKFDANNAVTDRPDYVFSFENPVDATFFSLRWQ